MYLKELTINGFKSFAKKSDLHFTTPITAIVGPNGSGKSNIAESFRFVLGEQSTARMRGKKGEDLIFGGSDKITRLNRANVIAVFDNSSRLFPVDFDELTIERIVHRDGSNEYLINGSRVRLKDVHEMLAAAHIGVTGHHIISQGEADRILTATPKLRREMIEDALGLKVYQYKISESERKLVKTRENMERVESLRRETAPHLAFLKRQVKKHERSIALREELADAFAEYLCREQAFLTVTKKNLADAYTEPKRKLAELIALRDKAHATTEDDDVMVLKNECSEKESTFTAIQREYEEVVRVSGSLEGQIGFLERRIAHRQSEYEQQQHREKGKAIAFSELQRLHEHLSASIARVLTSTDIDAVKRALTDVRTGLELLIQKHESLPAEALDLSSEEAELTSLRQKKEDVDIALRSTHERLQVAEHAVMIVREKIATQTQEKSDLKHRIELYAHEIRELEREIELLEARGEEHTRLSEAFENEVREAVALVQTKAMQYVKREIKDGERVLTDNDIAAEPREEQEMRQRALERLKIRLEETGGVNDDVIKEYKNAQERDEFLEKELHDLTTSAEKLEAIISDLTKELTVRFENGLATIEKEFAAFFERMFNGGNAKLIRTHIPKRRAVVMEDQEGGIEDEEEDEIGVDIDVSLPNKRVRGLEMLSGGERALTSIALIFAMSQINPPPFIILDETDAALDEANSRRYGDALSALAEKSQLILITHNRETMSRAGVLYGITMGGDGVSKLLSIQLEQALAVAKQ